MLIRDYFMASETLTEQLARTEMKFVVGENDFGTVLAQSNTENFSDIELALQNAGGKPKECEIKNYSVHGSKQGKPEYIITFKNEPSLIVVIECKSSTQKHSSKFLNAPKDYAVDGALYYAKYLKEYYNVIAVGISGQKKENCCVSSFFWGKNQENFIEYEKQRNFFLEPENYLRLYRGEKIQKNYSLNDIKETAIDIHESLRKNGIGNSTKPVFVAGLLIALSDKDFEHNFNDIKSFDLLVASIITSIKKVLKTSGVDSSKIDSIIETINKVTSIANLKHTQLVEDHSLLWYLKQLDQKIVPMMNYSESTLDALGVFYHEFIKYSGSDGKGLGIVLTPQHLTEFMAEIAGVNKNSKVVDICCGTGSFLVTAMGIMHKNANMEEWEKIRKENLYGIEKSPDHHLLALTNMIVRKDGKSNIFYGSCFDEKYVEILKDAKINIGLINPPYSLKGGPSELDFIEQMLNVLVPSGIGVAVVPMSCAIGTKYKEERKRLFENHTLKAVFSMPDDIFSGQNVGTNVCVMLWEAHKKHDLNKKTFFGYYKDDGFVKAKRLGRIDKFNKWNKIKEAWIRNYEERIVQSGVSCLKSVKWDDEWLCEAYMETDYSHLKKENFEETVKNLCVYELLENLKSGISNAPVISKKVKLNVSDWKEFVVGDLFTCATTKPLVSSDLEDGETPYITRSALNNGCSGHKLEEGYELNPANCITIGAEGTVAFYQPAAFLAGIKVYTLRNEFLNEYNSLFITTILNRDSYKYNYGRARVLKKIEEEKIKLPAKILPDGTFKPDWYYMTEYVKSLPFSSNL